MDGRAGGATPIDTDGDYVPSPLGVKGHHVRLARGPGPLPGEHRVALEPADRQVQAVVDRGAGELGDRDRRDDAKDRDNEQELDQGEGTRV